MNFSLEGAQLPPREIPQCVSGSVPEKEKLLQIKTNPRKVKTGRVGIVLMSAYLRLQAEPGKKSQQGRQGSKQPRVIIRQQQACVRGRHIACQALVCVLFYSPHKTVREA